MNVSISDSDLQRIRNARWKCRVDLRFLAHDVLGMKDIVERTHGPVIDSMQKFLLPPPEIAAKLDVVTPTSIEYLPKSARKDPALARWLNIYARNEDGTLWLPGKRRRLLIDSRGFLKTSLNCVAHTIQWLLNYPDIAILIFQASLEKAQDILREIKSHFQYNEVFRDIFPDYCPTRRPDQWGNLNEVTLPNRKDFTRREPSIRIGSIEKGVAGLHPDILKFSDIVDEDNSKSEVQVRKIAYDFFQRENLLKQPIGWIDIEGTRYDYRDVYGTIIDRWMDEKNFPGYQDEWQCFFRGCYRKKDADFTPHDMAKEYEKDEQGNRVSVWPERFPLHVLLRQEREEPTAFACQRLNNPEEGPKGERTFPDDKFKVITKADFQKRNIAFHTVTVDTASTQNRRSHNSVVTVVAWDWDGRAVVCDVRLGKFQIDELIHHIFHVHTLYKPQSVSIEETEFVKGLKPSIARYEHKSGIYLPLNYLPRDTNLSKEDRIENTLRPWWMRGEIYFLESVDCLEHIKLELNRFPKYMNDFLDTLADQFQTREWFGRLKPRPEEPPNFDEIVKKAQQESFNRRLKGLPQGEQQGFVIPVPQDTLRSKTGGL